MSPAPNSLSDADWFWAKVDRSGDCWTWTGALGPHGYGRVCLNQQYLPAHKIAWFLVMGTWPDDKLYKAGGPCGEWGNKANPRFRLCVKPDHHRSGAGDKTRDADARRRWRVSAHSGFPPEFRTVSQRFMSSGEAEDKLMALLLYRGNLSAGRAHALFNWTLLAQAEEAVRLGDIVNSSKAWPDAAHAVGLHKPLTTSASVGHFWGRMLDNPTVMNGYSGLKDYIETTLDRSGFRTYRLDRIERYSPWSTRGWRRGYRPHAPALQPMPEVWPFLPDKPDSDHDLVLVVDGLVPKNLPEIIRQDVCQDLLLAILEGEYTVENVREQIGDFTKRVFRQYPTKYGPLSLDRPAPWNPEGRTLGETIAAPDPMPTLGEEYADVWGGIRDALVAEEVVA